MGQYANIKKQLHWSGVLQFVQLSFIDIYCTVVAYIYVMCYDSFKSDCILRTMFLSKSDAVKSVWQAFENYVTV